jgi:hypothetical protein
VSAGAKGRPDCLNPLKRKALTKNERNQSIL